MIFDSYRPWNWKRLNMSLKLWLSTGAFVALTTHLVIQGVVFFIPESWDIKHKNHIKKHRIIILFILYSTAWRRNTQCYKKLSQSVIILNLINGIGTVLRQLMSTDGECKSSVPPELMWRVQLMVLCVLWQGFKKLRECSHLLCCNPIDYNTLT
jgi:hypothetical protein